MRTKWTLRSIGVLCLALLVLAPTVSSSLGRNVPYDMSILTSACVTGILVISLNLAMGVSGMFSLMHTGLLAVGGYCVGILAVRHGLNALLAIPIAMIVTATVALFVALISLRATDLYFGLITLASGLVIVAVAQQWTSDTGGYYGLNGVVRPNLGAGPLNDVNFFYLVLFALLIAYGVQRNTMLSPWGRRFQSVRMSPDTAQSLGVNPRVSRFFAFTLSGALAGLAGALYAQLLGSMSPDAGSLASGLPLFIALFLGGIGTLVGPLLGTFVLTLLQVSLQSQQKYSQLILGVVLLIGVFLVPKGIVGTARSSRYLSSRRTEVENDVAGEEGKLPQTLLDALKIASLRVSPTPNSSGPILSANGVTKCFGGLVALSNVNFDLLPGEVHSLIGPNGAGKSTLVGLLTGQMPADSGEILLDSMIAPERSFALARMGVTRVFQIPHVFEEFTVVDNVLTGLDSRSASNWLSCLFRTPSFRALEKAKRDEARSLLSIAGLYGAANLLASSLSHGERRLLEVVRAVATGPRVLVLDEPATGLTGIELRSLAQTIVHLQESGIAVLLVEHNMEFVMSISDRVTVLNLGLNLFKGTPEEVQGSVLVQDAYLGNSIPGSGDAG